MDFGQYVWRDQLSYCPTCFAAVPTLFQRKHAEWHASRDEPFGELRPLPEISEVWAAQKAQAAETSGP